MTTHTSTQPTIAEKLKSYLQDLSPQAREMLVRGIQSAKTRGDADPHLEIILKVARAAGRPEQTPQQVEPVFKAAFMAPLQPFVVDERLSVRQPARINAASVDKIWIWFRRDVAPELIGDLLDRLTDSADLAGPEGEEITVAARKTRARALPLARQMVEAMSVDEEQRLRLAGQVGGEPVLADLDDVLDIFQFNDALDSVLWNAPIQIEEEPEAQLRQHLAAIKAFADKNPDHLHLLAIRYLARASSPVVLVHFGRMLAKTDNVAAIGKTVYRAFIDVAWSEIDRCVEVVRQRRDFPDGEDSIADAVLHLHRIVRRAQIVVDVEANTDWGRRLAHCRRATSDILRQPVEGTPGLVKRALRPRVVDGRTLGPSDEAVQSARAALELLSAARKAIDSLALNEIVTKARTEVEQVIENCSKTLVDRLRDAPRQEREGLTEIVEAAIEFARIVFDEEYAALVRRSLHVANTKSSMKSAG